MNQPGSATHTFLFTDIEGSTRLIQAHADTYPELLAEHRQLIAEAVLAEGGRIFGTEGDALFCVFDAPLAAVRAAADAQRRLAAHGWPEGAEIRVRMGVHTGDAIATGDDYVGLTLHEVARLMSAGHGGQVLVSNITRQLVTAALPAGLALRDLGEHRLKDLSMPERLFQLTGEGLPADFQALRTLSARPNNLPVQLTSFVGRAELEEARRALAGTRLLTLSGTGGTGKTRLALQLAAEVSDEFPDGVYFVALDSVRDPALVATSIAAALGLAPSASETPEQRVSGFLAGKRVLLVLDNIEQIVDAAPYVGQLLRELAELKVVVTSRILLRIYGETEYPVPPLGLPAASDQGPWTAERAARYEAVRLFVERAIAAQPAFTLTDDNAGAVVAIVRRLDGLPLAIELAAARVRILSVEAIGARVDQRLRLLTGGARDRPERQQTLRGAIDWSYDLLNEPDRRLFDRFSIFAGGAYLMQAEPVCGPPPDMGLEVLDGLSSLAEKSLVRGAPTAEADPRFVMLATIREYGQEKLIADGDAEDLQRRHAEAFLALAETAEPELTGHDAARWLDRLELDHDNLRAALAWAVEAGEAGIALRLIAAVWRFWQVRGHLFEARRQIEAVLGMANVGAQPAMVRSKGYSAGGSIGYWLGDYPAAHRYYATALEAAREGGQPADVAQALYNLSFAPTDQMPENRAGLLLAAIPVLEESEKLYEVLGDRRGVADTAWGLGFSLLADQQYESAERHARKAFDMARELNDPFRIGWTAHVYGAIRAWQGDFVNALEMFGQALDVFQSSGDQGGLLILLLDYALVAEAQGDMRRWWRLAGALFAFRERSGIGSSDASFFDVGSDEFFWHLPTMPTDPAEVAEFEAGSRLSVDEAIDLAREISAQPAPAG